MIEGYYTQDDLVEKFHISKSTQAKMRLRRHRRITFVKICGRVYYPKQAFHEMLEANTIKGDY